MWTAVASRLGEAWAIAAGLQLVLWCVQQRTKNAGIVDVGWAAAFSLVVTAFVLAAGAPLGSWVAIACVVVAWSARLTFYLLGRGAASGAEEGRYQKLRAGWGGGRAASWKFFVFFQAQAALVALLSVAFVVPFIAVPSVGWLRWVGLAVSMVGVVGESVADAQLARFKAAEANRGKVCDVGLWSWSRHPNYFFEWCVWLGHAVYGLAFWDSWGWIAVFPQAVLLLSILFVTGIPPTEAQSIRSRGDAYRDYQKRVPSTFVPRPPPRS